MKASTTIHRSGCPINLMLEVLGDPWSLLIIRDIAFFDKRHFRELLQSDEGISSNILADRLKKMVDEGLLTKSADPSHKQKVIYSLTEKSIDLIPALVEIAKWGVKHRPAGEGPTRLVERVQAGGQPYIDQLMADLRQKHLGD